MIVGRKLVMDWGGSRTVAIEICCGGMGHEKYGLKDGEYKAILINVIKMMGEYVEVVAGEPANYCPHQELSHYMPAFTPRTWRTKEEIEMEEE